MANKDVEINNNLLLSVNIITTLYALFGAVGGAILGFLSLGIAGLSIGLVGGIALSSFVYKQILSLNAEKI